MAFRTTMITLCALSAAACGSPLGMLPGGALSGEVADFGEVQKIATTLESGHVIALETNPSDPYSVNVGVTVIDTALYIDPAETRTWYRHIANDPNVRFKIDGFEGVYVARAEAVTDPELTARFEPDRIPLRLTAR